MRKGSAADDWARALMLSHYENLGQDRKVFGYEAQERLTFRVGADPDATNRLHSGATPVKGGKGSNFGQYANPEVDRLLEEGTRVFDPEQLHSARQSPEAPPDFSTRRTASMTMPFSTALSMS